MKIDLFENKYRPSDSAKILFVDIVCFLLVAFVTLGICYAYFSDSVEVTGSATTAMVAVEYQYYDGSEYVTTNEVYGYVNTYNQSNNPINLNDTMFTPGDKITIVGQAYNTSDVSVYLLAKLTIHTIQDGEEKTEEIWYNIGNNDPGNDAGEGTNHSANLVNSSKITMSEKTGEYGTYTIAGVGAGRLGSKENKLLKIEYTFEGSDYKNGDEIVSIKLSLHVHQVDHLSESSDFKLYSQFEDEDGMIGNYTTSSIYATHYMMGKQLSE